jgi:hypothetical protein
MTVLTKRNALRSTVVGATMLAAPFAQAACTADVQSATLNGNTMTVTYEMDVSVNGYDHTRTSTFQNASSADLAAVLQRVGGRSEGRGADYREHAPIQSRVDAACDQAETGADRTIQRIIDRTQDPVIQTPVTPTPVYTKPDQAAPVVAAPQTRQDCASERAVIQIGVPCNCENAEEYVKEVLPEVHDHFRSQGWDVIYYVDQNWQSELAQVNVGAIHVNPQTNAVQYGPVTRGIQLMQSDARLEHEGSAFNQIVAAANRSVQSLGQAQRVCRTMQVRR